MRDDTVPASTRQITWTQIVISSNSSTMNKGLQIVFLCLVAASSVLGRPGYLGYPYAAGIAHAAPIPVHDTPEVSAAKAAHFAAYGAAAAAAAAAPDTGAYAVPYAGAYGAYGGAYDEGPVQRRSYGAHEDDGQYREGLYGDNGQYHGEGLYAGAYAGGYGGHYAGPLAGVPVIVNGVPADTPEVAAAKAAHYAAHVHAKSYYG